MTKLKTINDFQISDNFNLQEFQCTHPDHQHVKVDRELVDKLEAFREQVNKQTQDMFGEVPLVINSGYRCPKRNAEVGGVDESQHVNGKASDVSRVKIPLSGDELVAIAKKVGFTGIGIYDDFIHLDVRDQDDVDFWDKRSTN